MKLQLLRLLQERAEHWVVMEALCRELSAEPQEIAKAANTLQSQGFNIEVSPVSGYRYVVSAEPLWDELLKVPGCKRLGRRIEVVQSTNSTNDLAREAASDQNNDGLAIFAEFQTSGRGRQGASWVSPVGVNLLFSVLLYDQQRQLKPHLLTLAAGLALAQAVKEATGITARVKWPNDLLIDSQKIGGILVEVCSNSQGETAVIIGIGVNCNCSQKDLSDEVKIAASSLREMTGHSIDRHRLGRSILSRLDEWLEACLAERQQQVRDVYLELSDLLGQSVKLVCKGRRYSGRVVDLDPFEGILVQLDHGGVRLFSPAATSLVG